MLGEYTGGEPRWLGHELSVVPDTDSASLVEETEAASAALVRVGDIVARTHDDPDDIVDEDKDNPRHLFYMLRVTELAHVLTEDRTDDYNKVFEEGSVVIVGNFLEPDDEIFGPGPHHVWTDMECIMYADELIVHAISSKPKIVLLATMGDADHLLVEQEDIDAILTCM